MLSLGDVQRLTQGVGPRLCGHRYQDTQRRNRLYPQRTGLLCAALPLSGASKGLLGVIPPRPPWPCHPPIPGGLPLAISRCHQRILRGGQCLASEEARGPLPPTHPPPHSRGQPDGPHFTQARASGWLALLLSGHCTAMKRPFCVTYYPIETASAFKGFLSQTRCLCKVSVGITRL